MSLIIKTEEVIAGKRTNQFKEDVYDFNSYFEYRGKLIPCTSRIRTEQGRNVIINAGISVSDLRNVLSNLSGLSVAEYKAMLRILNMVSQDEWIGESQRALKTILKREEHTELLLFKTEGGIHEDVVSCIEFFVMHEINHLNKLANVSRLALQKFILD